ncbi:MAG: hypothetical protein R2882_12940 [Gemmatimonadales bacterium]
MKADRLSIALFATCLLATTAAAQGPFDGLHFRSIGPASPSGRIDDFAVLERDPRVFYVAAATGGIWKTTNGGITINPVFDNEGSGSVGAVAISPNDANLVWAGTGENNNRQTSSWGDGVYKSTDGARAGSGRGSPSRARSPRSWSTGRSGRRLRRGTRRSVQAGGDGASTRPPTAG